MITNIVLEGGGVKGIAYAGVLKALDDKEVLEGVEKIAGASAGAMAATLAAIGTPTDILKRVLFEKDFKDFEDNTFITIGLFRLLFKYGWHPGKEVERWFGNLIEEAGLPRDVTFKQLRTYPGTKDLYLKGTNVSRGKSVTFCASETPDIRILDAVRVSMSIPFFFSAVKINGEHYADGGVLKNYPIRIFDKSDGEPNMNTLGFRLDSRDELEKEPKYPTTNVIKFGIAVVSNIYNALQTSHLKRVDWERTIRIDTADIGAVDFNLSEQQKNYLYQTGYDTTTDYLDKIT